MNRNRFNVNNRSARVSLANGFGAREPEARTPKILTTYLGLLYYLLPITYYLLPITHYLFPIPDQLCQLVKNTLFCQK
jgi:hypothetical protein